MKVDAITEKILEDARQSAAQTLREANERAQETQRRSEAEIVKKRDQAMDEARRECVGLRDRMLRMAELDERKNLLSMKRQVIDQAFEDALKRMRAMDEASARAYLKRLILESAQGGEQIITDSADRKLYSEAFLAELNAELKKRGGSGALTQMCIRDRNSQGLNAGAAQLSEGLNALNTQYQAVSGAVSDLKKAVSALAAAAGGCDQDIANLKKLIGVVSQYPDLASDYAKYIASGKRLMGTMELLDAGLSQLNQKIGDFETALNQVGAAINQLNEGAKTLNGGIGRYTGAVDQLSGAINGVDLSDAAPQIQLFCQGMESLDKGLNAVSYTHL